MSAVANSLPAESVQSIIHFWQNLSPESLSTVPQVFAEQAEFKDAWHHCRNRSEILHLLQKMFARLQRVRFVVTGQWNSGNILWLEWGFYAQWRGHDLHFTGASKITMAAFAMPEGTTRFLCTEHIDYADVSALYEQLPWVGGLFRWWRARFGS